MRISYNGVALELLTIDRGERRLIMTPDQTQVLYTEWALSLSCVYAPSLQVPTSASALGAEVGGTSIEYGSPGDANRDSTAIVTALGTDPRPINFTMPGSYGPIYTDKELQLRLSVPRKPLVIWGYDTFGNAVVWLESPRRQGNDYLPRDAMTGPLVQATVVTADIGGGNLFAVQMEIKTWVPPCPVGSDRPILAHRWQMTHDRDENNYLTRMTEGEVYFHGGLMDQYLLDAGAIAKLLFHPIPLGFRRQLGPMMKSPDGLVVRYAFSDTDTKVVFDPGATGATQMVITENFSHSMPFHGPLLNAVRGLGDTLRNVGRNISGKF